MKTPFLKLLLTSLLLAAGLSRSQAQNFSIDWHKIAGGGGSISNGQYVVHGTIGQHDAGTTSGGNFTLHGGFWSIVAVQTPGAPLLRIQLTSTNTVLIAWPAAAIGYSLQQSLGLETTTWSSVTNSVNAVGGESQVSLPLPNGNRFFRLSLP